MADTPLRAWRKSTGLSIRDLEQRTGINRGRLSMWERGVPVPDEDMARIRDELVRAEREDRRDSGRTSTSET
jgi:transcriptional regulator with XRE-family HTH domain